LADTDAIGLAGVVSTSSVNLASLRLSNTACGSLNIEVKHPGWSVTNGQPVEEDKARRTSN